MEKYLKPAGLAALLLIVLFGAFLFTPASFSLSAPSREVHIQAGMGPFEIGTMLHKEGIIRFPRIFALYTVVRGSSLRLQAGYYDMSPQTPLWLTAERIAAGDVITKRLTIREGWDLRKIAQALENEGLADEQLFYLAAGKPATLNQDPRTLAEIRLLKREMPLLRDLSEDASLEGFLFPDTYEITKGMDEDRIVRLFLRQFQHVWDSEIAPLVSANDHMPEIVTLASLVEKEVRTESDKRMVADIILRRFEAGIPLQIDATVAYITDENHERTPQKDTEIASPYNTYYRTGLPPGPIANPGLESIKAVLDPIRNPYWFYLSTPRGETIYSQTYEEHLRAIQQYL